MALQAVGKFAVSAAFIVACVFGIAKVALSSSLAMGTTLSLAITLATCYVRNRLEGGSSLKEHAIPGFCLCDGHYERVPTTRSESDVWFDWIRLEGHGTAYLKARGDPDSFVGLEATWTVLDADVVRFVLIKDPTRVTLMREVTSESVHQSPGSPADLWASISDDRLSPRPAPPRLPSRRWTSTPSRSKLKVPLALRVR